jgi:hypothetical protein
MRSRAVFGRVFVKLPRTKAPGAPAFFILADETGSVGVQVHEDQGTLGGGVYGLVGAQNEDFSSGVSLTDGAWHCMEIGADSAAGTMTVWADGVEIARQDFGTSDTATPPADIEIGASMDFGAAGADVYFDEVAWDGHRIGCDK